MRATSATGNLLPFEMVIINQVIHEPGTMQLTVFAAALAFELMMYCFSLEPMDYDPYFV